MIYTGYQHNGMSLSEEHGIINRSQIVDVFFTTNINRVGNTLKRN